MAEDTTPEGGTPAATTPATTEPAPDPHPNDPHKYRRLFEKADGELKTLRTQLEEANKTAGRVTELESANQTAAAEALRLRVAYEEAVPADALDLLTGTDEADLRAKAKKIVSLSVGAASASAAATTSAAPVVPAAGTTTRPAAGAAPALAEKIAAAEKGGKTLEAITLRRQQMRGE